MTAFPGVFGISVIERVKRDPERALVDPGAGNRDERRSVWNLLVRLVRSYVNQREDGCNE